MKRKKRFSEEELQELKKINIMDYLSGLGFAPENEFPAYAMFWHLIGMKEPLLSK